MASRWMACGASKALPKKIRKDLLEDLTGNTKLTGKEVKALYARFRRMAPAGFLLPEQFKQTMGVIGLTDDPFLPDRMFQVFDADHDGKLTFTEFATSLAVMIRGTEEEKLTLSFKMAAGQNTGIALEDFRKLIRACSNTMSSLVAPPSSLSSDEDIERLFHDLSSDDDGEDLKGEAMITLREYQDAAQNNEEFLSCLGLDSHLPKRSLVEKTAAEKVDLQARSSQGDKEKGGNKITVTQAQIQDLRERLASLQEVLERSDATGAQRARAELRQAGKRQAGQAGPAAARSDEDDADDTDEQALPEEHWWTPLSACTSPSAVRPNSSPSRGAEIGILTSADPAIPASLGHVVFDEVGIELDKVLQWCTEIDADTFQFPPATEMQASAVDSQKFSLGGESSAGESRSFDDEDGKQAKDRDARRSARVSMLQKSSSSVTGPMHMNTKHRSTSYVTALPTSRRQRRRHRLMGPKKGLAVHFGHENWNMVLSMMIGIRMSVGRSRHEGSRELQLVDFQMKEKFSIIPRIANVFDSSASTRVAMTRFIDYAPVVFARIRSSFGIQHDEYVKSIGPEQLLGNLVLGNLASLSELSSEGKSGAFFYYTADGNFMIKTVARKEHRLLKRMLIKYYEHIMKYPGTLMVRFLGLHGLRVWKSGKYLMPKHATGKLYFVVMANMFNTPYEVHRRYDLKGSWVGRATKGECADPTVALKDVDFTKAEEKFRIGEERKARLMLQIEHDSAFLADQGIIDYSLLAGIHDIGKEEPSDQRLGEDDAASNASEEGRDRAAPRIGQSGSRILMGQVDAMPLHQRDFGGMVSSERRALYFVGIIDILTPYDAMKRAEHRFKALSDNWRGVSCCPPGFYAERFNNFVRDAFV